LRDQIFNLHGALVAGGAEMEVPDDCVGDQDRA
jgi:hypothetical protein